MNLDRLERGLDGGAVGSPRWGTLDVSYSSAAHTCPVPKSLPRLRVRAPKVSNQGLLPGPRLLSRLRAEGKVWLWVSRVLELGGMGDPLAFLWGSWELVCVHVTRPSQPLSSYIRRIGQDSMGERGGSCVCSWEPEICKAEGGEGLGGEVGSACLCPGAWQAGDLGTWQEETELGPGSRRGSAPLLHLATRVPF